MTTRTPHNFQGSTEREWTFGVELNNKVTVCGKTNLILHLFKIIEIFIVLERTFSAD